MFESVIRLFKKSVTAAAPQRPPVKKNATLPKKVSFTAPQRVQDKTQPEQHNKQPAQQDRPDIKPPALLLPPAEPEPVVVSKPVAERSVSMPLPSSISGEEVAMVQHAVKKTASERFTYVDKTHKPLVKEEPKKPNDIIKYNIKPLKMAADHNEAVRSDVIVYAGKTQN
jgi:hypothetical protein